MFRFISKTNESTNHFNVHHMLPSKFVKIFVQDQILSTI